MERQPNPECGSHRPAPVVILPRRFFYGLVAGAIVLGACGGASEGDASNTAREAPTPTTATALSPQSTLEENVQAELNAMPALDVAPVDTTAPAAEAGSAVLPSADQLLALYPSPVELSERYFEFLMPGFLTDDAIVTSMSVGQVFEDFSQTAIQTTRAQFISALPADQLAAMLKATPQSRWGLTEESTRKGSDGDVFELAFERGSDASRGADQLTFRLGRDAELDVTVVEIAVSDYTDATEIAPGLAAMQAYEADFGFVPPPSCTTVRRDLMVTTYNPRVPLNPSFGMSWRCATENVVAVREAITAGMAADPRFDPEEWTLSPSALVPPANDELNQFGHGAGGGTWRVMAEKDPQGALSVQVQLSLRSSLV